MKGVILVGGGGTRLRPLTCHLPKAMVPVLNRPFLEVLVGYLKKHKIDEIIVAMSEPQRQIEDEYGNGARLSVRITYSVESFPLGTAGAVKNAERFLKDDTFFVFNGDVFTDIDLTALLEMHRKSKALATIALTPVDDPTAYGVVETDSQGRVKRFVEKPSRDKAPTNMINAGIYVLEPEVLEEIAPNSYCAFEHDVFPLLVQQGQGVYGFPWRCYWIDIGTPERYLRLQHDLLYRCLGSEGTKFEGNAVIDRSARISGPTLIGKDCFVAADAVVEGPAVLGSGCHIAEGAMLKGSVLWRECKVGKGARLENCVLASNCCVGEESEIPDGCVLGEGVLIAKGQKLSPGIKVWPANYRAT